VDARNVLMIVVDATSVEAMFRAAHVTLETVSIAAWLRGPMLEFIQERAEERFLMEGNDDGPWKELKQATLDIRMSLGFPPGPINYRTGELERFITGQGSNISPAGDAVVMTYPSFTPTGEMGEKVATAQGFEAPKIPARQVLGLGELDVAFAQQSITSWFELSLLWGGAA
jgi:hypothetical protein